MTLTKLLYVLAAVCPDLKVGELAGLDLTVLANEPSPWEDGSNEYCAAAAEAWVNPDLDDLIRD